MIDTIEGHSIIYGKFFKEKACVMLGEKGDNRSVAKLYFIALSTTTQFLLIDTPLFFYCVPTNIFFLFYVIFISDKFVKLQSDYIKNTPKIIKKFRKMFIINLIINHIVLIYFVATSVVNSLESIDISLTDVSLELIYGISVINLCFLSPAVSEYFVNILDKDQPLRR